MRASKTTTYKNMTDFVAAMIVAGKVSDKSNPFFRFRGYIFNCGYSIQCANTNLAIEKRARGLLRASQKPSTSKGYQLAQKGQKIPQAGRGRPSNVINWDMVEDFITLSEYGNLKTYFDLLKTNMLFHNSTSSTDYFTWITRVDILPERGKRQYCVGKHCSPSHTYKGYAVFEINSGIMVANGPTKHAALKSFSEMSNRDMFISVAEANSFFQMATREEFNDHVKGES